MTREMRALRGATTLDIDTSKNMEDRMGELMDSLVRENQIEPPDIVSIIFTATPDISSAYPATAARKSCGWLEGIPLLGAQELGVESAVPLCIRVLIQFYTEDSKLKHIYLHAAKDLRADTGNP